MERWYAVRTQPGAERKAAFHLGAQGWRTYLPCYRKKIRHARRVTEAARPLFPRYLFVAVDVEAQRWRAIRSTIGVVDIVLAGDRPAPVPEAVVAEIRAREDAAGLVVLPVRPAFAPGQRVAIETGAFAGQTGIFACLDDADRVVVLLDLLGREVELRLSADTVAAA